MGKSTHVLDLDSGVAPGTQRAVNMKTEIVTEGRRAFLQKSLGELVVRRELTLQDKLDLEDQKRVKKFDDWHKWAEGQLRDGIISGPGF